MTNYVQVIGQGISGKVRKATHFETSDNFAIKIINTRKMDRAEVERTKREIAILEKLRHDNIIRMHEVIFS